MFRRHAAIVWPDFRVTSLHCVLSDGILLSIMILLNVSQGEPGETGLLGPAGAQGPPASTLLLQLQSL